MTDTTKKMKSEEGLGRRDFLRSAVVGGAAAATTTGGLELTTSAQAQQQSLRQLMAAMDRLKRASA